MSKSSKGRFTQELIDLIGVSTTRKLMKLHGGQYVYFPQYVDPEHPLVRDLGLTACRALAREYGGLRLLIPMGYEDVLRERNALIHQARDEGATISELVRRFQLCPRSIYTILASPPPAARLQARPDAAELEQLNLL
jgi:Mor family transcriptional regulator